MNKYRLLLSTFLLAVSMSSVSAAVIQDECTNLDDGAGGYYGVSCIFEYRSNLIGSVALQTVGSDAPPAIFDIFGTLTQQSWYEEDFYGASSAGETTTVLTLNLGNAFSTDPATSVQYTATRVDTLFDFNTTIGLLDESLLNTSYYLGRPNDLLFDEIVMGIIGGVGFVGDHIEGYELMSNDFPDLIATINVSPVPVPAAIWLFASGLFGLVGLARRKR